MTIIHQKRFDAFYKKYKKLHEKSIVRVKSSDERALFSLEDKYLLGAFYDDFVEPYGEELVRASIEGFTSVLFQKKISTILDNCISFIDEECESFKQYIENNLGVNTYAENLLEYAPVTMKSIQRCSTSVKDPYYLDNISILLCYYLAGREEYSKEICLELLKYIDHRFHNVERSIEYIRTIVEKVDEMPNFLDRSLASCVNDVIWPDGHYLVPWSNVSFGDGYLTISNIRFEDGKVISFRHNSLACSKSMNDVKRYLKERVPKIHLILRYGEVAKCYVPDIRLYVEDAEQSEDLEVIGGKVKLSHVSMPRRISLFELRRRVPVGKSKYIDVLCAHITDDSHLYRYTEDRVHKYQREVEDGFIFQLSRSLSSVTMAYENRNDDRATLIFFLSSAQYDRDLAYISSFMMGEMENKRQFLEEHDSIIINDIEYRYRRVCHGENWDAIINKYSLMA